MNAIDCTPIDRLRGRGRGPAIAVRLRRIGTQRAPLYTGMLTTGGIIHG